MNERLTATAKLIDSKVQFSGIARDNKEVIVDYPKPIGEGEGYTSLELFLISLATCAGTSVASMLRKMQKEVSGLVVTASGERREEHPTYFRRIWIKLELKSSDAEAAHVEKAIQLSEETYCPVWNMVKSNVEINCEYEIQK